MPTIELPEFGSNQTNENEPTTALKQSGWADGDQPPASVLNWQARATYDSLRSMLGMQLARATDTFSVGDQFTNSDNDDLNAIGIDALSGHIVAASYYIAGTRNEIYMSDDGGLSFARYNTDGSGSFTNFIAFSDGVYALALGEDEYYYAAYPYTAWTKVVHAFGGAIVGALLADIGDGHGPSMLVLTDAGSIWVTDAASVPTAGGDWTEYDVSSLIPNTTGFALDSANGILGVVGDDGADGFTMWCDVANGVAAGDFSVPQNEGGSTVYSIAFSAGVWVLVRDATSNVQYSTDITSDFFSPVLNSAGLITSTNQHVIADPRLGLFLIFDGTVSGSTRVLASRDGIRWVEVASGANLYLSAFRGSAPKIHPDFRVFGIDYDGSGQTRRALQHTL